jgi:hypothetical protein
MSLHDSLLRALRRDVWVVWVGILLAFPGWLITDYAQNYGSAGKIAFGVGLILGLTGLLLITVGFWFVTRSIKSVEYSDESNTA